MYVHIWGGVIPPYLFSLPHPPPINDHFSYKREVENMVINTPSSVASDDTISRYQNWPDHASKYHIANFSPFFVSVSGLKTVEMVKNEITFCFFYIIQNTLFSNV